MTSTDPERAVYRLYGEADELLYVGSSNDPERRWRQHAEKSWWAEVRRNTVEWHPRHLAWGVEVNAIWRERPKYNRASTQAYCAEMSAKQQKNATAQSWKCRVAREANLLRHRVASELEQSGVRPARAVAEGMLAERAYKEASGAFPKGVDYPPLSYIQRRLTEGGM
ncbi:MULTISPECIES: GIY-YIG nuclease family protein [unclassified Streptomyces]|uniref:GIY-YIG nuclease family protein n=1 Tax=unclassified Streptomyces TaxID=2593676 RepID=UPI001371394C|nr:GIY-YIG nuclease family protein [Streptomyces sp. LcepLS]MYR28716.1 GIY-YIG nuclease family protein [Streptomyces sp. SID4945]